MIFLYVGTMAFLAVMVIIRHLEAKDVAKN